MKVCDRHGSSLTDNRWFVICRLLATDKKQDAGLFLLLSTVGHYSLFPLIFTMAGLFQFLQNFVLSFGKLERPLSAFGIQRDDRMK